MYIYPCLSVCLSVPRNRHRRPQDHALVVYTDGDKKGHFQKQAVRFSRAPIVSVRLSVPLFLFLSLSLSKGPFYCRWFSKITR